MLTKTEQIFEKHLHKTEKSDTIQRTFVLHIKLIKTNNKGWGETIQKLGISTLIYSVNQNLTNR